MAPLKPNLTSAFELVGGRFTGTAVGKAAKAAKPREPGDDRVQPVIDAAGQGGGGLSRQFLRRAERRRRSPECRYRLP